MLLKRASRNERSNTGVNIILVGILVLVGSILTRSQERSWKTIAPFGESFRVMMPVEAVEFSLLIPLNDKDSIRERVYESVAANKRYLVASFIKTHPDRLVALSTFESFITGIQQSFSGREGDSVKSLIYDRDVSTSAGRGKEYRVTLGDYSGTARFLETDKAFYALIVIGAQQDDPDVQRFLTSFTLSESNTDSQSRGVIVDTPANAAAQERVRSSPPPGPWTRTSSPIMGGVLNGRAISLPVPEYPEAARKAHASGMVQIDIIISERGHVVWAKALDGPPSLQVTSLTAAWKARFTPTTLMGQPVKVRGRIIYNFVAR
jgi:TonB family protein